MKLLVRDAGNSHPYELLVGLTFLYSSISIGQINLSGKVIDATSHEALIGATIYLQDIQRGTATDNSGVFHIEKIPRGVHKLQVSYVGYETVFQQVKFDKDVVKLDFELNPTATETHEVVISSGYISAQDENAVKIDVVSDEDIVESGSASLIEGLVSMPGVNQVSTGVGIGKPVIRGLTSNRVLVVYDGIRRENQQWGAEHGLGISDLGIESSEIIKGPASLVYGSDALGGVLHIIPERKALEGEISGNAQFNYFSNTAGHQEKLGIKGNQKGIFWSLNGLNARHSDFRDGNGSNIGNSRFSSQGVNGEVGIIRNWGIIEINYDKLDQLLGLSSSETVDFDRDFQPVSPYQEISNEVISAKNSFFINKTKLKFNASRQFNDRKEYEDDKIALHMLLETYTFDLKGTYSFNENTEATIGSQALIQTNKNKGEEILIPDALTNRIGFFALIKSKLGKKLFLNSGLRYDITEISTESFGEAPYQEPAHNLNFGSYSAALGGTYSLNDNFLVRANVASGFRSPNLSELTSAGVHEGANRYERGNASMTNEQNLEFDLSTHYHSKHINGEVAGFYNRIYNFIRLTPTNESFTQSDGEVLPVYVYSQADAGLYGGEISFDIHPHPLDWLHYEFSFESVIGRDISGTYLPFMPANGMDHELKAKSNIGFLKEAYLSIGLNYVFKQNKVAFNEIPTGAYDLWRISAGWKMTLAKQDVSFGLAINNLFNKAYYSHLSRLKTEGILNRGRNLTVFVKVPFKIRSNN